MWPIHALAEGHGPCTAYCRLPHRTLELPAPALGKLWTLRAAWLGFRWGLVRPQGAQCASECSMHPPLWSPPAGLLAAAERSQAATKQAASEAQLRAETAQQRADELAGVAGIGACRRAPCRWHHAAFLGVLGVQDSYLRYTACSAINLPAVCLAGQAVPTSSWPCCSRSWPLSQLPSWRQRRRWPAFRVRQGAHVPTP